MVSAVAFVLLTAAVGVRLWTDLAIPGWTTYVVGLLVVVLLQAGMFTIALTFLILGARQQATVIPCRDYAYYVAAVRDLPVGVGER